MLNLGNLFNSLGGMGGDATKPPKDESLKGQAAEAGKGQGKAATKMVDGKPKGGGIGNDIANVVGSLVQSIGDGPDMPSGMDFMGDFDLDGYLNKNLSASKDGDGLTKVIGGLMKMVGLGG